MAKKKTEGKGSDRIKVEVIAPYGCGVGDKDYDYGDVIRVTRNQADGLLALKLVKEIT